LHVTFAACREEADPSNKEQQPNKLSLAVAITKRSF